MKNIDNISEIGIDNIDRLCVKPEKKEFAMIWRSATEVHWDKDEKFLYSPKPREWTYLMWFQHIVETVNSEYDCVLILTPNTKWGQSISEDLKTQIIELYN